MVIDCWIKQRLHRLGAEPADRVPEIVPRQIEEQIGGLWKGAPDPQLAAALAALSRRLLETNRSAKEVVADSGLISSIRGGNVRSTALKSRVLFEPVRDDNAFWRLKTVIAFLRGRIGYPGFHIAFD